jgi:hypothetical protein
MHHDLHGGFWSRGAGARGNLRRALLRNATKSCASVAPGDALRTTGLGGVGPAPESGSSAAPSLSAAKHQLRTATIGCPAKSPGGLRSRASGPSSSARKYQLRTATTSGGRPRSRSTVSREEPPPTSVAVGRGRTRAVRPECPAQRALHGKVRVRSAGSAPGDPRVVRPEAGPKPVGTVRAPRGSRSDASRQFLAPVRA